MWMACVAIMAVICDGVIVAGSCQSPPLPACLAQAENPKGK
jgi:hypothetical protein